MIAWAVTKIKIGCFVLEAIGTTGDSQSLELCEAKEYSLTFPGKRYYVDRHKLSLSHLTKNWSPLETGICISRRFEISSESRARLFRIRRPLRRLLGRGFTILVHQSRDPRNTTRFAPHLHSFGRLVQIFTCQPDHTTQSRSFCRILPS
jgi:hypothetical protein